MKSSDFARILMKVADLTQDREVRAGLSELAGAFDLAGVAAVAATLKRAGAAEAAGQGLSTAPLVPLMRQVQGLLDLAGKPPIAKDFAEVLRVIEKYPALAFASSGSKRRSGTAVRARGGSSAAVDAGVVERYDRELAGALGNEAEFAAVYARLQADPQAGPRELQELARKFSGAPGKSKAEALRRILGRHQNVMLIKAKDRATAGRSAA